MYTRCIGRRAEHVRPRSDLSASGPTWSREPSACNITKGCRTMTNESLCTVRIMPPVLRADHDERHRVLPDCFFSAVSLSVLSHLATRVPSDYMLSIFNKSDVFISATYRECSYCLERPSKTCLGSSRSNRFLYYCNGSIDATVHASIKNDRTFFPPFLFTRNIRRVILTVRRTFVSTERN